MLRLSQTVADFIAIIQTSDVASIVLSTYLEMLSSLFPHYKLIWKIPLSFLLLNFSFFKTHVITSFVIMTYPIS
jgi:hypothetical protein